MRRLVAAVSLSVAFLLSPVGAQEADDEPGFLGRQIQNALSGPGREVRVFGFEGALSSRATMARMTFADADGVWLTLENAVLDWNRAALLRGRLSVNALSADRVALDRTPLPAPDDGLPEPPSPEASGFSLPELPVAVNIENISLGLLELGAPVLGEEATFRMSGRARLEDGSADVSLALARLDAVEDRIALDAAFSNETRNLALDLTVREGPGGLASALIGIPGAPSLALDIVGTGPLDDYSAVVDFSTQGVQRIGGQVTLRGTDDDGLRFTADVGGDITPVIAPDFSEFFGPDVRLLVDGVRAGDGALTLDTLEITARSLDLAGTAALDAAGQPVRFALNGVLADPDGGPVRLPAGAEVTVERATLTAGFNRERGEAWTLDLQATAVDAPGAAIPDLSLDGAGTIALGATPEVTANLSYAATGLALDDRALAEAIGPDVKGTANLLWAGDAPLTIRAMTLGGADYGAEISGTMSAEDRTLKLDGRARVSAEDLSRFSRVSGQDLTGRASVALEGSGDVLGGLFEVTLDVDGTGLGIGQEIADRFLEGPVRLNAAARRDLEGTYLDAFTLDSTGVAVTADGAVGSGESDVRFNATLKDVSLIDPAYQGALTLEGTAAEQEAGLFDVSLDLDGPYGLTGDVGGLIGTADTLDRTNVTLDLSLPDLSPFVPEVSGPVSVRGSAAVERPGQLTVDLKADAPEGVDLAVAGIVGGGAGDVTLAVSVPDVAAFAPGVAGAVRLDGRARERAGGQWALDLDARLPFAATAAVQGEAGPRDIRLSYSARVPDVGALSPALTGSLEATGLARQIAPGRFNVTAEIDGPYDALASVEATLGGGETGDGRIVASADVTVPDLSPLAPTLRGGLTARADVAQQASGAFGIGLNADGPFASRLTAEGTVGSGDTNATARLSIPDIGALAPSYSGPVVADIAARQAPGAPIDLDIDATAPYGVRLAVDGRYGMGQGDLDIDASIPNISPFAPGLAGALAIKGGATERPQGWAVDIQSRGPATAAAAVTGIVGTDGSGASLRINGTAPLQLVNGILAPQRVEGDLRFDLALDGPPGLDALSGTISTSGAELQVPGINLAVNEIGLTGQFGGGRIVLDGSASSTEGGGLSLSGPITLSRPFPADLRVSLNNIVLADPSLYRTTLAGDIALSGPLTGTGGTISGGISVGETELRIPSGGTGFAGAIPQVDHLAEPADVFLTRERAGLINTAREARGGQQGRTVYGLNIGIDAPRRIFLRGRGLDTELGGAFRIGGTTRAPAPVGAIEVIRGRLNILGKRLDLQQDGRVTLGGDLVPFLDLTAVSSDADELTILIGINGPVNAPQFVFRSSPQLPEDEILARFFFNKGLANLSPLQAAQLANSVAQLTGSGGVGLLGGIREGLGVDDFNVVTNENGEAALQIGQYLTDNIYTDVTTSSGGMAEVNINIDLTDNITIKGSADNAGDTSLGVFFERDY